MDSIAHQIKSVSLKAYKDQLTTISNNKIRKDSKAANTNKTNLVNIINTNNKKNNSSKLTVFHSLYNQWENNQISNQKFTKSLRKELGVSNNKVLNSKT